MSITSFQSLASKFVQLGSIHKPLQCENGYKVHKAEEDDIRILHYRHHERYDLVGRRSQRENVNGSSHRLFFLFEKKENTSSLLDDDIRMRKSLTGSLLFKTDIVLALNAEKKAQRSLPTTA